MSLQFQLQTKFFDNQCDKSIHQFILALKIYYLELYFFDRYDTGYNDGQYDYVCNDAQRL
jgi:hypothetical protein